MHVATEPLANEAQPGNAGMSGFCHRALRVEVKDGFRSTGALLGQPPPAGVAHARCAITHRSFADEINIGVIAISWPVSLEIVEEGRSVRLETVRLKIAQRKRKAVIDAD